jgi:hypothetical protein
VNFNGNVDRVVNGEEVVPYSQGRKLNIYDISKYASRKLAF